MSERTVLYYTFGNHMHWVDMEWLWGYHVLPGSVRDMLRICRETGARGNVNFDGIGYEKLAGEHPEAFAELKEAVEAGTVEVVGGSYGQPYGLFHGGEANVRQRVYGARTVLRLFGRRLRTFWEEEFDFFPQLPQLLAGVGVTHASLFFQWTWHTPHIPQETAPAIWWIGLDGTRLLTAPRGPLNLHQWPEDFALMLEQDLPGQLACPGVVQWLELMPSPDWMCRSELMLPPLRDLLARQDYEMRLVTLREYLDAAEPHAVTRRYGLDDVFHGMSLGKNGDLFRRLSRRAEADLLAAEALATVTGFMGRPYPRWDVYPTWELEEAWRELLAAQHHDNDECEGLCGHIGGLSYQRSLGLGREVLRSSGQHLADRAVGPPGRLLVFNPLGWERSAVVATPGGEPIRVENLPAFGYRVVRPDAFGQLRHRDGTEIRDREGVVALQRGDLVVEVDRRQGTIVQLRTAAFPEGVLRSPLGELGMVRQGTPERFATAEVEARRDALGPYLEIARFARGGEQVTLTVRLSPLEEGVDLHYRSDALPRPDGGVGAALATRYATTIRSPQLIHDHPYGVGEIRPRGSYRRKYPSGDWMTSEQWFEEVERPFTALSLLDIGVEDRGLLLLHDGSQAFGLEEDGTVRQILSLYDPWDEDYFVAALDARIRLLPHGPLGHAERWRHAREFTRAPQVFASPAPAGDLPAVFAPVRLLGPGSGVRLTALYRETEDAGRGFPSYAGRGFGYPTILRLVEFDGRPAGAELEVAGTVAAAVRTNLLGEAGEPLTAAVEGGLSRLRLELRPFEIATLYLDVVEARKAARDLDARRRVWALIHREDEREDGGEPAAPRR